MIVVDSTAWNHRLTEAFSATYPGATSPRVDRMRPVQEAETDQLWRCRVRWREPDGPGEADLALRIGLGPEGAAACQREARALRIAADREVPAPSLWLSATGDDDGFVACDWITAEPFSVAWRRHRPDAAAEVLAGLLVDLHEATGDRPAATAAGTVGDTLSRLTHLVEERAGDVSEGALEALVASRPKSMPAAFCHGDYRPEKVLLKNNGAGFVVGWAHAGYGDPRLDLARATVWLDDEYGGALRAPFLRIYRQTRPVDPADLDWFERLARLERTLTRPVNRAT